MNVALKNPLALISLAAAAILHLSIASAQTEPTTADSTDSHTTHDNHTSLYFYFLAGLTDNFDHSELPLLTVGIRYSSAQERGSSRFGFIAGVSADATADHMIVNAAIGIEMISHGFVAGGNGGVAFVVNHDDLYGFAEVIVGYELPLARWAAARLQGGPIIYFDNSSWGVTYRGGLGFVFR